MMLGSVVQQVGGAVTVLVHGELDVATGHRLAGQVTGLFDLPLESLTLDLEGVSFMDSSGLMALNTIRTEAADRQVPMFIAGASRPVTRVLEVTNTDGLFTYR